jgi:hypothetical protein
MRSCALPYPAIASCNWQSNRREPIQLLSALQILTQTDPSNRNAYLVGVQTVCGVERAECQFGVFLGNQDADLNLRS